MHAQLLIGCATCACAQCALLVKGLHAVAAALPPRHPLMQALVKDRRSPEVTHMTLTLITLLAACCG